MARWVIVAFLVGVSAACGGGPTGPSSSGPLVFRAAPIDPRSIVSITPLGNLNPPGHTLPTSHIYVNTCCAGVPTTVPVSAPADGRVAFIFQSGADAKIGIQTGSYTYALAGIGLDAGIREGGTVTAGQRIGMTLAPAYSMDFGLINEQRTLYFANPARYPKDDLNGDAPLRYFEEPLRSQLYSLVHRLGSDLDGKFDFDQAGRLVGNWFLEGLSPAESSTPSGWPRQLAFVYDNYDPSSIRVSIGGTLPLVGAFAVQPGAVDPKDVSVASGKVTYQLVIPAFNAAPSFQAGVLIVQMLDSQRIRVDVTLGQNVQDTDFTAAARIYTR